MKLLTKEILKKLPALYSQDGKKPEDVNIIVKLFHPAGRYTLYVTEYDPKTKTFYGYVKSPLGSDCDELGYASLEELEGLKVRGLGIERDMYFGKHTLAEAMAIDGII